MGDNVLIGAPEEGADLPGTGAVYLFDSATGELLQTFRSPTNSHDDFGRTVTAIGNNVLVGARQANLTTADGTLIEGAGAAYLFDAATGELLRTFVSPNPTEEGDFGYSVAPMGDNILVGGRWDHTGRNDVGAVYLFDGASGNLLQSFFNPTQRANGEPSDFGRSIAAAGNNVVVAARDDDSGADGAGAAFLFDGASGELLHTFTSPTPAQGEEFGFCVAALGDDVLVGARWDNWQGVENPDNGGAVYLFDGATGLLVQTIVNPSRGAWDGFGISVAPMGDQVLVGTQFGNAAYLFDAIHQCYSCVTDATGAYRLTEFNTGTYRILDLVPKAYVYTLPAAPGAYSLTLGGGDVITGLDFGAAKDEKPVAQDDRYSVHEDVTLTIGASEGILVNDTDAEGDPLTARLVNTSSYGTLTMLPDGFFAYTPKRDFNGSDSFTYRAGDGITESRLATVTITVTPAPDPPVAQDDGLGVFINTPRAIPKPGVLANDTDADRDPLTALLVTPPAHGQVVLESDGSYTYTPQANYAGEDSFTYKASDRATESNLATVKVFVGGSTLDVLRRCLRITEVSYSPYAVTPQERAAGISDPEAFEFIELWNAGQEAVNLIGVQFSQGIAYSQLGSLFLAPGQYALLVKDRSAFEARYGTGLNIVGQYSGDLSNGGERIELKDAFGQTVLAFSYSDRDPWPRWADGYGSTLEIVPATSLSAYGAGTSWRASSEYGGSPGRQGLGPLQTVVVNEVLTHTDLPLTDSIELYNRANHSIDVSGWYLSESAGRLKSFRIPNGTVIAAGGYLVFDEHDFNPGRWTPGAGGFALNGAWDGEVWLTAADASGKLTYFVDHVAFGPSLNGESLGRWPSGTGELCPMQTRTLGSTNSGPRAGPVQITEVMYNAPVPNGGTTADYLEFVEIYNPTAQAVSMGNWKLKGDVDFVFSPDWPQYSVPSIPAGGTLLFVSFSPTNAATLSAFRTYYGIDSSVVICGPYSGRLGNDGGTVRLMRPDFPPAAEPHQKPYVLVDEVIYDDATPWPAGADGQGQSLQRCGLYQWGNDATSWTAATPSPGRLVLPAGNLAIVELDYNPCGPTPAEQSINPNFTAKDFEFIELLNFGQATSSLAGVRLTAGVEFEFTAGTLAPGERAVIVRNLQAFQTRYGTAITVAGQYVGALDDGGETITLNSSVYGDMHSFTYSDSSAWPDRADGNGSSLELLDPRADANDGANWRASTEYGGSPGIAGLGPLGTVVINEVLANTDLPLADAIELYNPMGKAVNLSGWYLSDSTKNPTKFRIPDGTVLPAGGYVAFDERDFNPTVPPAGSVAFSLDGAEGDDVCLTALNASGKLIYIDHAVFGPTLNGESLARWPNGAGELYPMQTRTLGTANSGPRVGPVVISEVMYHPRDPGEVLSSTDEDDLEYIEVHNPTQQTVDLSNWEIGADVRFKFPAGTTLAPNETLLVLRFNPLNPNNLDRLNAFRYRYYISPSVRLVGGYSGEMSNSAGRIQLYRAEQPPADNPTFFPIVLEDQITYGDVAPWPIRADGWGDSLARVRATLWGDDPAGWVAVAPTPGTVPQSLVLHAMTWNGPADGKWESGNWTDSPPACPDWTADVVVNTASTVRVDSTQEAQSLAVTNGGRVEVAAGGTLTAINGVALGTGGSLGVLAGGTLALAALTKGADSADLQVDGGTLKAMGPFATTVPITVEAGGATVNTNGFDVTLGGAWSANGASGGLTKTGTGKLAVSAANAYEGGTTVSQGTLEVAHASALPAGTALSIGSGATVVLSAGLSPDPGQIPGTAKNDAFRIARNPVDSSQADVFINAPGPAPTRSVALANVPAWNVMGGAGDDELIVDFSQGNPVPVGGLVYDGGSNTAGDRFVVRGTAGNDSLRVTAGQVLVNSAAAMSYHNVEAFGFELGTGGNSLTVDGATVRIDRPDGLTPGISLSIGTGGTVVLASGLTAGQAAGFQAAAAAAASNEAPAPTANQRPATPAVPARTTVDLSLATTVEPSATVPLTPPSASAIAKAHDAALKSRNGGQDWDRLSWLAALDQMEGQSRLPKKRSSPFAWDEAIANFRRFVV